MWLVQPIVCEYFTVRSAWVRSASQVQRQEACLDSFTDITNTIRTRYAERRGLIHSVVTCASAPSPLLVTFFSIVPCYLYTPYADMLGLRCNLCGILLRCGIESVVLLG